MLAGLDGAYLLKQTMARSLIPKGFCQESLFSMCGALYAYRPCHHADCSHNKSLQLSAWVRADTEVCSPSNLRMIG
jgi:hypothetical protein